MHTSATLFAALLLGLAAGATACGSGSGPPPSDGGTLGDGGSAGLDGGSTGFDGGGSINDGGTSGTDGGAQCPIGAGRPAPRAEMFGVFDATRRRVLFYGGDDGRPVQCNPAPHQADDLWYYDLDCATFVQGSTAGGPGGRARGLAVLDGQRDRMILFGGRYRAASSGAYQVFNDVWALDLGNLSWNRLTPTGAAPQARSATAGAYNGATQKLVLFGGNASTSGASFTPLGDAWTLDLQSLQWQRLIHQNTAPEPRLFHAVAVDPATNRFFVYGGGDANAFFGPFLGDLWVMDLNTNLWTRLHAGGAGAPLGRIWSTLLFDGPRNRLVLFGGHDDGSVGNNNDTWAFDLGNKTWQALVAPETVNQPAGGFCSFPSDFTIPNQQAPDRRSAQLAVLDPVRQEWLVFGGKTDCGIIDDLWSLDLAQSTWREILKARSGEACLRWSNNCSTMCN